MKKDLRWVNLFVVSKDKCINSIKTGNSTGNFYNNQAGYKPKRQGMPFSGMIKLKLLKVCRIKSIKSIKMFFSFKKKKDNMTKDNELKNIPENKLIS